MTAEFAHPVETIGQYIIYYFRIINMKLSNMSTLNGIYVVMLTQILTIAFNTNKIIVSFDLF